MKSLTLRVMKNLKKQRYVYFILEIAPITNGITRSYMSCHCISNPIKPVKKLVIL